MGTSTNWLKTIERVRAALLADSVSVARKRKDDHLPTHSDGIGGDSSDRPETGQNIEADVERVPREWPPLPHPGCPDRRGLDDLIRKWRDDPRNPKNWHRRLVNEELAKPRAAQVYFKLRRALWQWEEFAGVRPGARRILETVIELARDEAFPWYVAVPAEEVRRLTRLTDFSYGRSVRELECMAITRPARVLHIATRMGVPVFPGWIDEGEPATPIAQWVIRYRRGIPWNRKRAAWWINYDLLCKTGCVLPCFVVTPRTLSKTYHGRNGRMGRKPGDWLLNKDADGFAALEERLSRNGPLPPIGLRAALWRECKGIADGHVQ